MGWFPPHSIYLSSPALRSQGREVFNSSSFLHLSLILHRLPGNAVTEQLTFQLQPLFLLIGKCLFQLISPVFSPSKHPPSLGTTPITKGPVWFKNQGTQKDFCFFTYVQASDEVFQHTHAHMYIGTHVHTTHACIHIHTAMNVWMYTHVHACVHMHTNITHTHTDLKTPEGLTVFHCYLAVFNNFLPSPHSRAF